MPKKGATLSMMYSKVLLHNAVHNDNQKLRGSQDCIYLCTQGLVYRRINPISRGRAHRILKRTSHVDLTLSA
jgi:ribosomal protein L22